MNLQSPGCLSQGTIIHEMIHALGFRHEQSRADRDDYVNIHFENVERGRENNFDKVGNGFSNFGVGYNTRSIMHYGNTAFSSNGRPTITAKVKYLNIQILYIFKNDISKNKLFFEQNGGPVGSQGLLQNTDIQRLKNMYQC